MKCPNCGKELEYRSIFCEGCGVKIDYEAIEKEEEAKAAAAEDEGPFAAVYAKRRRRRGILVGIGNIILFIMFFSEWFGSDFLEFFGDFGYSFFDIYCEVGRFARVYNNAGYNFFDVIKNVPFGIIFLCVAMAVCYVIAASKLFSATIRLFAKKTRLILEYRALTFCLLTALWAFILVLALQIEINKALGGADIGSSLISVSGAFILFVILALVLLYTTRKNLRDDKEEFAKKDLKIYDWACGIWTVIVILCFLSKTEIIEFPEFNLIRIEKDSGDEYEYFSWDTGNVYDSYEGYEYDDNFNYANYYEDENNYYSNDDYYEDDYDWDAYYEKISKGKEKFGSDEEEFQSGIADSSDSDLLSDEELREKLDAVYESHLYGERFDIKGYKEELRTDYADYYVDDYLISGYALFDYTGDEYSLYLPDTFDVVLSFAFSNLENLSMLAPMRHTYFNKCAVWNCPNFATLMTKEDYSCTYDQYSFTGTKFAEVIYGIDDIGNLSEDWNEYEYSKETEASSSSDEVEHEIYSLHPLASFATSVLPDEGNHTYGTDNLYDDDITTAYVEGVEGLGEGETVSLIFKNPCNISSIYIRPGYDASKELFEKNSVPTAFTVTLYAENGDEYIQPFEFSDAEYGVEWGMFFYYDNIFIKRVDITIDKAQKGTKYEDTCISEVSFWGYEK